MSKIYEVTYTHLVERKVTELVRADSEEEAIDKSQAGEYLNSDEDCCPEDGLEIKDYAAKVADDATQKAYAETEDDEEEEAPDLNNTEMNDDDEAW